MLDDKDDFGKPTDAEYAAWHIQHYAANIKNRPKPTKWHRTVGFSQDCAWLKKQIIEWQTLLDSLILR